MGRGVGLIHGPLQVSHRADCDEMAGIRCTLPPSSPDFSHSLGEGGSPSLHQQKMTGIQTDEISLSLLQLHQTDP